MSKYLLLLTAVFFTSSTLAAGVLPASSVVIVEEKTGDGTIVVTNTDSHPVLLTTELVNVMPEYKDLIIVTPQLIRVEPEAKQLVRFLLTSEKPLEHEVLMRVIFEGIPPQKDSDKDQINFTIRQNIPLMIKPSGLPSHHSPWEKLSWKYDNASLKVSNPSPYIVRISTGVTTMPGNINWILPSNYILPNQTLILKTEDKIPSSINEIIMQPFTQWGYSTTKKYTAKY